MQICMVVLYGQLLKVQRVAGTLLRRKFLSVVLKNHQSIAIPHPGVLGQIWVTYTHLEKITVDVFILTSTGVYRVVDPSLCNYTCSKEEVRNV